MTHSYLGAGYQTQCTEFHTDPDKVTSLQCRISHEMLFHELQFVLCTGKNKGIIYTCMHGTGTYAVFPNATDISGNDWCGPVSSSPAADRMSDQNFGANPVFGCRNLSLGPAKNDHVHPLGLAIICEEVKQK